MAVESLLRVLQAQAHHATLAQKDVGWKVPMNDGPAWARLLMRLDTQREEIAQKSERVLVFANEHEFELTFVRRMEHCLRMMRKLTFKF